MRKFEDIVKEARGEKKRTETTTTKTSSSAKQTSGKRDFNSIVSEARGETTPVSIKKTDGTTVNVPKSAIPSVAGSGFRMLENERKKQEPYGGMQGYAEAFDYYNARNLDVDATKKKISDIDAELQHLHTYDAPNEAQTRADLLDARNTLERTMDKHYGILSAEKANAEAQKRREYLMNLDIPATEKEISTFPKQIEDAWNSGKFESWRDAELSLKEREETLRRDITEASRLQRLEREFKPMMSAPDFEATSVYDPNKYKSGKEAEIVGEGSFAHALLQGDDFSPVYSHTGYTNDMYEYINGNEEVKRMINANQNASGENLMGTDLGYLDELTEEERKLYNSITHKMSPDKANEYIELLKPELLARQRAKWEAEAQRMGEVHPWKASLASVVTSPLKGISLIGQGLDYLDDGYIDKNAGYNKYTYIPKAQRAGVSEVAERNWGAPGSFFYNTGMSIADFLFATGISGGNANLALGIMGSGAAADTTLSALDRGIDSDKAMALGIIAGTVEILTERISMKALFDEAELGENAFKYFLNNAFEEGREEGISGLTNMIADVIVSKDKSEWQAAIDEYVMRGESQNKAFALALADQAASLGLDILGGMLSGAGMAAGPVAVNAVSNQINARKGYDVSTFVDLAKQTLPDAQTPAFDFTNTVEPEAPKTENATLPEAQIPNAEPMQTSEIQENPKTDAGPATIPNAQTPINPPTRVRSTEATENTKRLASTFGVNGEKAFTNALPDATAEEYRAFSQIYLHGLGKSKISAETLENAKSVLPAEAVIAAESSAQNDALVAEQAKYFGKDAKLVMDDAFKRANLKTSEARELDAQAKATGTQIMFVDDLVDESGERVNAEYSDGVLRISLKAKNPVQVAMTHEIVHRLREIAPEEYYSLAQHVGKNMSKYFYDIAYDETSGVYKNSDTSDIREEIVADAFGTIMGDKGKLESFVQDNRGAWQKIKDIIHDLIISIKRALHKNSQAKLTEKQRFVFGELLAKYEEMENVLNDALERTFEKVSSMTNEGVAELSEVEQKAVDALGDGADVITNENGEMLIATNENTIVYSKPTYENGGRDALVKALKENGHTEAEINDTVALIDDAADYLTILAAGYAQTHGYTALSEHLVADIITNVKTGKQVLSAIVNNGDYPINIDLALICKKRVAYMKLMSRLIDDGVFDQVNYSGEAIAKVNEILRDDGFETACLGCFVESRRLQLQTWAETISSEWNEEVDKRTSNAESFNFAEGLAELTDEEMDALARELESAGKKNDQGNLNLGQGSVQTKMDKLLDKVPSLRKHLSVADLLKPEGLTALRTYDSTLFSLVKSRYGAASPKIVQDFNPYASEIAMMTFASVKNITSNAVKGSKAYKDKVRRDMGGTPKKMKGETNEEFKARKAKFNTDLENEALRRYLYDIGGARIQSFSDFMIENVFDYMQIFADLSAKRLPLHGYTKEIIALRLFGMTGAKWNGSLIAHVDRNMGKENAGLLPASEAKNGNAILVHTKDGDFAIGFDDYARYKATNKESFVQSIGMKDIIALQYDPRYSPYVGNITIGVSDNQILAMLDSPLFRFIIPYHSSGMLPQFAKLVGVDLYNDYQAYQNTSVKKWFDLDGNPCDPIKSSKKSEDSEDGEEGSVIKPDTSYNFNAEVQKTGDPKKAAENYLQWCAEKHPVYDGKNLVGYATFSPKFSDSPYGNDFTTHENYYKLLQDFNNYDNITEEVALQGAVTMNFPSEQNRLSESEMEAYKQRLRDTGIFNEKEIEHYANEANKTFKELIEAEVHNRAEYQKAQTPKWESTVGQIKETLLRDHNRKKNSRSWSDDGKEFVAKKISASMNDTEREQILKNKQLSAVRYSGEVDKIVSDHTEALNAQKASVVAATIEKIKENFDIPNTMVNDDFEIVVTTTSGLFDESSSKKITDAKSLVKLMPLLEDAVKNAVAIESHTNKYFYDNNTIYFLSMISGYAEGDMFVPIRFGVKQATDGNNYLYVIIDNEKIKMTEITADASPVDRSKKPTDSVNVSIAKLLSNVNSPDILKYVPDGFLDETRKTVKYKAIADTIKRTNEKNDNKYRKFVEKNNVGAARLMVRNAAKANGYTQKMFHETNADNIHIFDVSRGDHGGTDSETPYGIFTKTSDKNIGLGDKQMELYVKAENTLRVKDRAEVKKVIPELVPYYDKIAEIDKHYDALLEKLEDAEMDALYEWVENHPDVDMDEIYPNSYIAENKPADIDDPKYIEAHNEYKRVSEEWKAKYSEIAVQCKDIITSYLRDNGYDSMYFEVDGGSRGRQTDSLILLDSNQVKSAETFVYDDNDNIVPLSERFNPEKDDIRYSRSWRDDGKTVDDYLNELGEKYGNIPKGEKPARAIDIPMMTEDGKFVGETVRTILEAGVTPDEVVPTIKELVADGTFSFDRYSDEDAMADADDYIETEGWNKALSQWKKDSDNGKMSKKHTTIGWALYNNAATANDTETALEILDYMVRNQRNAGQALQATRILKKLSPTAQLYAAVRTAKKFESDINERFKVKNPQAEKEAEELTRSMRKSKMQVADDIQNDPNAPFVKQVGDELSRQIISMQNTRESRRTVFQEITAQLKKFAKEKMPTQAKAKPISATDILRDYIQNQDFYAEAWQIAQENLREEYADNEAFMEFINSGIGVDGTTNPQNAIFMKALVQSAIESGETKDMIRKQSALGFTKIADSIADNLIKQTGAEGDIASTIRDASYGYVYDVVTSGTNPDSKIVDSAIRSALKDIQTTIGETVRANKGESVTNALIDKLVTKYGFGIIEATNTADVISARFNEMCREYAQKTLETMFKEKPPRNRKTIPEQIELLASLGAFDVDSKFNALAAERIFKLGAEVKVNEDLAQQFLTAKTETSRKKVLVKIYQDIGSQLPSTFRDKWNAWRYLSMLGNTTTHLRNIFGNAIFAPIVATKTLTATAIESMVSFVSGGKFERTKGFSKNFSGLMKAAWDNYDTVADLISGGGKYDDVILANKEIEKGKKVFQGKNVVSKGIEAARRFNSGALELEDMWFSKPHYTFALAQYCAAHKISESDIASGNIPKEAYDYAIKEAQKATFRDLNAVSALVSKRFSEKGEHGWMGIAANTLIDGALPFRKTPANILVRGMEYSPLGLAKTITVDLYRVSTGKITGAEFIDNLSAGLTGSALTVLGIILASSGLIRGRGGDDKEKREFEKLMGHQEYALELPNGTSVTLDWIAPSSMPFFFGVGLYEQYISAKENKRDIKMEDLLQAVSQISGPMLEMSFLQSLNMMIESVGYSASQGEYAFPKIVSSILISYLSSAVPTIGGKIERVGENIRYQTYPDKNKWLTQNTQRTISKMSAKIPGFDYGQIPYIDAWGREESTGNVGTRLFNNFLNTAYTSRINESKMEKELLRLYEATDNTRVLPSVAQRKIGDKDLTAQEYVKYATAKGQKSREICESIVSRDGYKKSDDDIKVKMIDNTYDYANQVAKTKVSKYDANDWVKDIQALKTNYNVPEDVAIMVKVFASETNGVKDRQGKTIDNSKSLLVADMIYNIEGVSLSQKEKLIETFVSSKEVRKMNKALVAQKVRKLK